MTDESQNWMERKALNNRTSKRRKYRQRLAAVRQAGNIPLADKDRMWLDVAPVGREFGSADYPQLSGVRNGGELDRATDCAVNEFHNRK